MSRISFEEFSSGFPVKRIEAPKAETTQRETPSTEPGLQARLAEVGGDVSSTISQAISGEGQFAEQSPLERGVSATAAGVSTVPRGAVALAPEPIRKGIAWAGEKIGAGFNALTGKLAETDLIKEAVGYQVTDPETGVSTFVPQEIGVEPGLNIAAGAGEIAGTIAGANPKALLRPGGTPEPRMQGTIPVKQFDTQPQPVRITNGVEKNEQILSQFGDAPQPSVSGVGSTVQGIGQQVADFAGRTVREAQDVAKRNQELAALPEVEANIRRAVSDDRVIDLFETLSPEEVLVTQRLVDQAKLKQKDITTNTQHPKVIAGEELLKPVQFIIDTRKSVGSELGEMRKQLDTRKNINTNTAFRNFHQHLKTNYGVQFDTQGNIVPGVGTIARSDTPEIQKLYDEMRSKTFASQLEIDQFLQRTLKDFDLKQSREQTFSDEVSRIAEQARSDMRQLMPEQYNALSTEYARLSKPLTDMIKLLGYKGDLDALTAKDLKAGEVGMRILGNAADRPQSIIDNLINTAEGNGYSSSVNLNNIIAIADQLESLYDITPNRSLSGQVTGAVENSNAIGAMGDAATMNIGGLYNRAMQSRATQREVQDMLDKYIQSKLTPTTGATAVRAVTPETEAQVLNLSKRLNESSKSSVPEYLRNNPQGGFAAGGSIIPERITPQSVAKKMDDADFDAIAVIMEDVATARQNPAVNRLLVDMKIGKASDDDVKAFLQRTSDEYAKTTGKAQSATTKTTDLVEEAKKYDSAEEFVRAQGTPVYHGTNQDFDVFGEGQGDLSATKMGSAKEGIFFTDSLDEAGAYGRNADKMLVANENAFNKQYDEMMAAYEKAELKARRSGDNADWDVATRLQEEAEDFYYKGIRSTESNARVIDAYLDVKNPLVHNADGQITSGKVQELIQKAKKEGKDGVILKNVSDNPEGTKDFRSNHTIVFSPNQIKTRAQLESLWEDAN